MGPMKKMKKGKTKAKTEEKLVIRLKTVYNSKDVPIRIKINSVRGICFDRSNKYCYFSVETSSIFWMEISSKVISKIIYIWGNTRRSG